MRKERQAAPSLGTLSGRALSLLVALVMAFGLVFGFAGNAIAKTKDGSKDILAFTSDTHNKSGNVAANRLGTWIDSVQSQYGDIDVMAFGGDMADASASESNFWTLTQADMDQLSSRKLTGVYTTGNHEYSPGNFTSDKNDVTKKYVENAQGASGDNFLIYCFGSSAYAESGGGSGSWWGGGSSGWNKYTDSQISTLTNYLNSVGNDKPIFIITHYPLHYNSSRTISGASDVIDALNTAVTNNGQKIVFLWGHNHTDAGGAETNYDRIFKPGDSITYSAGNSKTIKFYYGAAGCMSDTEYSGSGSSNGSGKVNGKGLVATIDSSDKLSLTYHDINGTALKGEAAYTEQDAVAATGISVSPTTATIDAGGTTKLTATLTPTSATENPTWTSSNTSIATVNANGTVTGVAAGTATITAAIANGQTATATITVNAGTTSEYTRTDTFEDGKQYLIANGDTGSVYVLTSEAGGSKQLKGVSATVSGDKIAIASTVEAKAAFTAEVQESRSGTLGVRLENGGKYLYTNSSNGLTMATASDAFDGNSGAGDPNKYKVWHYKADGKNLLWFFLDTASSDGYNDTSSTYKYFLKVSNGNFTDDHASTTSLANTTTPAMYLYVKSGGGTPITYYSVTFNANGHGSAPSAQTVASGSTATKPADPTATGYTFGGWYKEAACTNAYDFSAAVTGNITLYAKWTEKPSGSTTYKLTDTLEPGKDYIVTNAKTGSAFALANSNGSVGKQTVEVVDNTITTDDTSIVFTTSGSSSVNAVGNNGRYLSMSTSSSSGTGAQLSLATSAQSGMTWAYGTDNKLTAKDANNTFYIYYSTYQDGSYKASTNSENSGGSSRVVYLFVKDDGSTPTPTPTYTVTFDANGHGTAPAAQTVTSGATATKPADPTATGYTFGGWYKEAACTNAYDFSAAVTGNITLYAKWTAKPSGSTVTYTLTDTFEDGKQYLIANGNTGSVYVLTTEANGSKQLKGISATVSGEEITISADDEAKAAFTAEVQQSKSGTLGVRLENGGKYLYTDSSNGLRMADSSIWSGTSGAGNPNADKVWHYKADGKNLLWFFLDTASSDGYSDTSSTYKYYLKVSGGSFTDDHVSNTSLASTTTPAMYLYVRGEDAPVVPVAEVTLSDDELSLTEGGEATLTATVSPSDATDKDVAWSSSDESVATVDQDGNVTAVGAGTATITATAGGKSASCEVTVEAAPVEVEGVTLDKTDVTMTEGMVATLTATVTPEGAAEVAWSSSDESVATVDQDGNVTAVGEGTATITATAGGKSAECAVTVTAEEPPAPGTKAVYRMYNRASSEHLYTTEAEEYAKCGDASLGYQDWEPEGIAWYAPEDGAEGAVKVYRLYNDGLGDHHYTTDKDEADDLIANHGWVLESVPFWSGGDVEVFRLYNGGLKHGQHHFTADASEVEWLTTEHGWTREGVGMYCVSVPVKEE